MTHPRARWLGCGVLLLLAAVVGVRLLLPLPQVDGRTGDAWLKQAITAQNTVTYQAVGRVRDSRGIATFTEIHGADGAMRLTYTDAAHHGASVAAHGETLELRDVQGRTTRHARGCGSGVHADLDGLLAGVRVHIAGTGRVAGRRAVYLLVRDRASGTPVQRMALDRVTAIPLRVARFDARGRLRQETVYTAIAYRPVTDDECLAGGAASAATTNLGDAVAKTGLYWNDPRWLPKGFVRVEIRPAPCACCGDAAALQGTYRDGLRTLLVTIKATGKSATGKGHGTCAMGHKDTGAHTANCGGPCRTACGSDASVVTRTTATRDIIVVGDLSPAVLTRIANSVPAE